MKKFVTILMLVATILVGGMTIEAKTTKKKSKARTSKTSKKSTPSYASFKTLYNGIIQGKIPTYLDFEIKNGNVECFNEYDTEFESNGPILEVSFDEKGRVNFETGGFGSNSVHYTYDSEGRIKTVTTWSYDEYTEETEECKYEFKWTDKNISEISENWKIYQDSYGGKMKILYQSPIIHMVVKYSDAGNIKEARCVENPKVYALFDEEGNIIEGADYYYHSKAASELYAIPMKPGWNLINWDKKDGFSPVKSSEFFPDTEEKKGPNNTTYKYDQIGNWILKYYGGSLVPHRREYKYRK